LNGGLSPLFPLLAPNGTAAAPSYSFASDTDVGAFRVGGNTYGIAAGGELILSAELSGAVRQVNVGAGTNSARININGTDGGNRDVVYQSAGSNRWFFRCNSDAESGSNAGSNFQILARTDAAGVLFSWNLTRANGRSAFPAQISFDNSQVSFESSLINPVIYSTSTTGSAPFNEAGHLILQSRSSGAVRDIILVTGTTPAIRLRIANGRVASTVPIALQGYTVAGLPAGAVGDTAYVTDALGPAYGVAVTGGGAVTVPVFYDGTNWITA
jgi:hypothetical protein